MIKKTLRRIFFLPLTLKLLWILPFGAAASLFFLGAYLASGAADQARLSLVQNYQSHALIYTSAYRPAAPDDPQGWWVRANTGVQQLELHPFVRGFTRRTKLPAFMVRGKERIPVDLILIEDGDEKVFTPFMVPPAGLPENAVSLGVGLSVKYGIEEGSELRLNVPALDTVFSNLRTARIYSIRDVYYQNYTIFMHQRTAAPALKDAMKNYHLRFTASPFSGLLLSNTQPLVPNSLFVSGVDSLEYPLRMLQTLRSLFFQGLMVLYLLAGMLYAFAQYRYSAKIGSLFRVYCHIHGISPPSMAAPLAWNFLSAALMMGASGLLLSLIFENLPFEFLIFSPYSGLFSEFTLRVSQGIVPQLDFLFMMQGAGFGALVFTGAAYLSTQLFRYFETRSRDLGPLIVIMLLVGLIAYLSTIPLLSGLYAKSARDEILKRNYFGQYTLQHKYRPQSLSSGSTPPLFLIRPRILADLNAAGVPYLVKLEAAGEIVQPIKINEEITATNRRSVHYLGLRGNALPELQPLIDRLESNQVIIGKGVDQSYQGIGILNFRIYGEESNITVSLPVSARETFDIPYYNDCVFMNIDTLSAYLGAGQGGASAFLAPDREALKYLPSPPNPDQVLSPFAASAALWTALEKSIYFMLWICFCLGIASSGALLAASFYAAASQRRQEYVYEMFWRKQRRTSSAYITAGFSVLAGVALAAFSMVPSLLSPMPLPPFLQLAPYTPPLTAFQVDGQGLLLAFLWALAVLAAGYGVMLWALGSFYYRLLRSPEALFFEDEPQ